MNVLSGKNALITGSGRGFGLAIAQAFADAGARVTLTARTSAEIESAAAGINRAGGVAQAITADVLDGEAVRQVYASHLNAYGAPDILVNCAGITSPYGPVGAIDVEEWWQTQAILVKGPLSFMRLALPDMQRARRGRIINVASIAAQMNIANTSAYAVGKSALIRLSELAALEYASDGIQVFPVHPGVVYSRLSEQALADPDAVKWLPDFLDIIRNVKSGGGNPDGLRICGEKCVALASGAHDDISGRFINFEQPGIAAEGGDWPTAAS